jgi:predicted DNA-binding protein
MADSGPTAVRIPDDLKERIRAQATLERRNFSQMVRVLIERGLEGGTRGVHDPVLL